jgi:hypothetical protein
MDNGDTAVEKYMDLLTMNTWRDLVRKICGMFG